MTASVFFEGGVALPGTTPADITNVVDSGFITGSSATHDAFGRFLTRTDARTGTTAMGTYLDNGSLLSITDPGNRTTSFTYDTMGRRLTVDAPNTAAVDPSTNQPIISSNITHTSYTVRGQVQATWGDQTYPRAYEYDAQGRMTHLHTYKTLAHGTEPTLPGEAVTEWIYDSTRGWLTEKNYHSETGYGPGGTADYTYTPAGRLQTRTWERGITTTYSYDQGLFTIIDYSDSTPDLTYTYDNFGRIDQVTRAGQLHADYDYDAATLQLTSEHSNIDTPAARYLVRAYENGTNGTVNLRPRGMTVSVMNPPTSPEHEVTYTYDAAGRFETVSNLGGNTFTYGYLPHSGSLIESVTGPAHTVTNAWESDRNVLDKKENKAGSTLISSYDYTVNAIGQRIGMLTNGSAMSALGTNPSWNYNTRGELVEAADTNPTRSRSYQYDAIGNRTKSAEGTLNTLPPNPNYTANAKNQYTAIAGANAAPSYNDDGNATQYPLPTTSGVNATLIWDAENRLVEYRPPFGPPTYYSYDYLGRRLSKTIADEPGKIHYTLYDGWNPIVELVSDNGQAATVTESYTWGLDLSDTMQGAGGVGGLLAVHQQSLDPNNQSPITNHYYLTYDGNGNVSEYLTEAGIITAHFEYDPFGNTTVESGTNPEGFSIRFSTKKHDSETGLYYYGYRYYDPVTGRWPSRDPIGERGGLNIFSFVRNDSVGFWDYLGLTELEECTIIIRSAHFMTGYGPGAESNWDDFLTTDFCNPPSNSAIIYDGCGANYLNSLVPDPVSVDVDFDEHPLDEEEREEAGGAGFPDDILDQIGINDDGVSSMNKAVEAAMKDAADKCKCDCESVTIKVVCPQEGNWRGHLTDAYEDYIENGGDPGEFDWPNETEKAKKKDRCGKSNTLDCESGKWSGWSK